MEESISEQTPISVSVPRNSPDAHPSTQTSHPFSLAGYNMTKERDLRKPDTGTLIISHTNFLSKNLQNIIR
ncbi:hypothetical protein Tco_0488479 [Tanacetum coccineum]